MQRRYEFFDLLVAVGLLATIVAGGMLFMAADGTLSLSPHRVRDSVQPTGVESGLRRLQPVLGQAIVGQVLLDRGYERMGPAAVARLETATEERTRREMRPFGYLDSIKALANSADAEQRARVQTVMGHAIVRFTRRGVQTDLLPPSENTDEFNLRMIERVEAIGRQMEGRFAIEWQPSLGRAIVSASQGNANVLWITQERLGAAIVRSTSVESLYEANRAAMQEQIGGAIVVATQAESQPSSPDREAVGVSPVVPTDAQDGWPEIPLVSIVVASFVLMGVFSVGLVASAQLPEVHASHHAQVASGVLAFPKPA